MRDKHPIEVQDYERRLNWAVRFLKAHPEVSQRSKDHVVKFLDSLKAEGLSVARQAGYVQRLTTTAVMLKKDVRNVHEHSRGSSRSQDLLLRYFL